MIVVKSLEDLLCLLLLTPYGLLSATISRIEKFAEWIEETKNVLLKSIQMINVIPLHITYIHVDRLFLINLTKKSDSL